MANEKTTDQYLGLKFWDFDQEPNGWREITSKDNVSAKDYLEAAKLCKLYFDRRKDIAKASLAIVSFHAGQNFAFANSYQEALAAFEQAFQDNRADWNAYVKGTMAFLKNDKNELLKQRTILAKIPGHMNLEVLDRLTKNFGKPYAVAYSSR